MLFILDASIADSLEANTSVQNPSAIAVDCLAEASRCGYHIILGDILTLDRIIRCTSLSVRTKTILNKIRSQTPFKNNLIDQVAFRVIVEDTTIAPSKQTIAGTIVEIRVSTTFLALTPSVAQPAQLLTENLNDGRFYANLAESTIKLQPELTQLYGALSFRYTSLNGGGNTTADVYHQAMQAAEHLCLCIADSDRKCPTASVGETAKRVNQLTLPPNFKSWNCDHHIIDVRTIENLIPISELQHICGSIDNAQLLAANKFIANFWGKPAWKYLPLKKGIRCYDLNSGELNHQVYWRNELAITECTNDSAVLCENRELCTYTIYSAISDQVLSRLTKRAQGELVISLNHDSELLPDLEKLSVLFASFFCAERISIDLQD